MKRKWWSCWVLWASKWVRVTRTSLTSCNAFCTVPSCAPFPAIHFARSWWPPFQMELGQGTTCVCVSKIRSHVSHHLKWNIQHCVYQFISGLLPTTEGSKSQNCSWFTNHGESLHNISLHSTHWCFTFSPHPPLSPRIIILVLVPLVSVGTSQLPFPLSADWRWSPTRT